jgi:hypothetical protein
MTALRTAASLLKSIVSTAAVTAVVATATLSGTAPSFAAKEEGSFGGKGGGRYDSPCRPRDGLVGIKYKAGTALDSITAVCVPISASRTEWAGSTYTPTQQWGGGGGGRGTIMCQNGDVIRRIKVHAGPWGDIAVVKFLTIECEDLATDYTYKVQMPTNGTVNSSSWLGCSAGRIGSGIYGNAGMLVDRVGLACDKYR